MKNVKINFLVGDINAIGGVESVTRLLAASFVKRGAEVRVHSIYSKNNTYTTQNVGFPIVHYGLSIPDDEKNIFSKIKRTFLNGYKLRKSFKRSLFNENVIFQGFYIGVYLPFLRTNSKLTFICEHNTYNAPGRVSKIVRKIIYRFLSPLVVVLTEADRQSFSQIGCTKVIKIYNPSPFPISSVERSVIKPNLISLGRFTHQKRFDLMINICAKPLKGSPEWNLVIQGKGEELSKIEEAILKCESKEQVKILPAGDPIRLYEEGAIFLMTSLYEGLPMTLIESMSYGIPVVSFECSPGLSEIIHDGKNGFLIKMDDSESFIDKLYQLIKDPLLRKQMGDNAKLTAEKFSIPNVMQQWEKILK